MYGTRRINGAGHFLPFLAADKFGIEIEKPGFDRETTAPKVQLAEEPNKAPEPTTFAVTSRAIVRFTEMKQQNPNRDVARAAPAKVVAHL
jgi:hypothetical protein